MTSPYSSAASAPPVDPYPTNELARIEHVCLEMLSSSKDLVWNYSQLKPAIEAEARRGHEFRAAMMQELREMRQSIDKLTATVEFLKSGLSVATASHSGVQANRKW